MVWQVIDSTTLAQLQSAVFEAIKTHQGDERTQMFSDLVQALLLYDLALRSPVDHSVTPARTMVDRVIEDAEARLASSAKRLPLHPVRQIR